MLPLSIDSLIQGTDPDKKHPSFEQFVQRVAHEACRLQREADALELQKYQNGPSIAAHLRLFHSLVVSEVNVVSTENKNEASLKNIPMHETVRETVGLSTMRLKNPHNPAENGPPTAADMDVVTKAFGLRFVTGGNPEGLVEFYVEDDGLFHYKTSFNHFWLQDLIDGLERARSLFPKPNTVAV